MGTTPRKLIFLTAADAVVARLSENGFVQSAICMYDMKSGIDLVFNTGRFVSRSLFNSNGEWVMESVPKFVTGRDRPGRYL